MHVFKALSFESLQSLNGLEISHLSTAPALSLLRPRKSSGDPCKLYFLPYSQKPRTLTSKRKRKREVVPALGPTFKANVGFLIFLGLYVKRQYLTWIFLVKIDIGHYWLSLLQIRAFIFLLVLWCDFTLIYLFLPPWLSTSLSKHTRTKIKKVRPLCIFGFQVWICIQLSLFEYSLAADYFHFNTLFCTSVQHIFSHGKRENK